MNSYDSDRILESVEKTHSKVNDLEKADVIVFNTCHIREKAAEKLYSEIGKIADLKNKKKSLKLIVTGCVAQAEGKAVIKRQPIVDAVVGPQMYHEIPGIIKEKGNTKHLKLDFENNKKFLYLGNNRVRAKLSSFVTIQEGCDKFCSFCVVPFTRGSEFSRSVEDIKKEIYVLAEKGCVEVILLGQNVNAYHGINALKQESNLCDLIEEIEKFKNIKRISYTTSHPRDMTNSLIELHGKSSKLNPYLHLPVQSGSDKILKNMNRKYTAKEYIEIIELLRKRRPDIALSSDFIVGFPGETKSDFRQTINLVKEVDFAQAYSFKYSKRTGTKAVRMNDCVSDQEASDRLQELQQILSLQQKNFNKKFINKNVEVIVKGKGKKNDQYRGSTKWMQSVNFNIAGEIKSEYNLKILNASQSSLLGEVTS